MAAIPGTSLRGDQGPAFVDRGAVQGGSSSRAVMQLQDNVMDLFRTDECSDRRDLAASRLVAIFCDVDVRRVFRRSGPHVLA
eukprot:5412073-Pyramimonas_sp.AAC.1